MEEGGVHFSPFCAHSASSISTQKGCSFISHKRFKITLVFSYSVSFLSKYKSFWSISKQAISEKTCLPPPLGPLSCLSIYLALSLSLWSGLKLGPCPSDVWHVQGQPQRSYRLLLMLTYTQHNSDQGSVSEANTENKEMLPCFTPRFFRLHNWLQK